MVKVKLYTVDDFMRTCTIGGGEYVTEYQGYFEMHMLWVEPGWEEGIPFRDAESVRLLRESYGVEFVSDGDWFSVRGREGRMDVSCLNDGLRFALVAISRSRKGGYTWFAPADERIWRVLADLPFDILVAMRTFEMGIHGRQIEGIDYQIINYPYNGRSEAVTVLDDMLRINNEAYTEVAEARECGTGYGLCTGKDGRYYTSSLDIGYAFQYYWKNDIGGILRYIECSGKDYRGRVRLADTSRTYNIFDLGRLLRGDEYCILMWCDLIGSEEGDRESVESSPVYAYFRDTFKVTTHMKVEPKYSISRRLPKLMVDKNSDGTYFIHGGLTYKHPQFEGLIRDMIDGRSPDRERFVLIVDVEELMKSAGDIEHALCGFRILADSVDAYDAEDAVQLFGEALEEAYYSGKCTVDKEFY